MSQYSYMSTSHFQVKHLPSFISELEKLHFEALDIIPIPERGEHFVMLAGSKFSFAFTKPTKDIHTPQEEAFFILFDRKRVYVMELIQKHLSPESFALINSIERFGQYGVIGQSFLITDSHIVHHVAEEAVKTLATEKGVISYEEATIIVNKK